MRADEPREIDRREFLVLGGVAFAGLALRVPFRARGARGDTPFAPSAYLRIASDDTVTIVVPRPDMGQGVRTSLPMLVAEELDVPLDRVVLEQAGVDAAFHGEQYSGGSNGIAHSWTTMRTAGAIARAMLVAAAAREWNVEPSGCSTERGAVLHPASGRRLTYGALARAASVLPVPTTVALKEPSAFTLIGTRVAQLDAPRIVAGEPLFGIDVRVPGMLHASIERAPSIGARIASIDDRAARAVPGVRDVVRIDADALPDLGDERPTCANGVAVIADSTWTAMTARRLLRVAWTSGRGANESTRERTAEARRLADLAPRNRVRNDGDVDAALAGAARRLEATYELPLVAHACMEPMNATARVADGRCEIWAPTQNPEGMRAVLARVLALPPTAIDVHVMRSGGGFGRRFYADYAIEAALLARAAGAPVQVVWTREDDLRHGFPRPGGLHRLRAGLDANGAVHAWSHTLINTSREEFLSGGAPAGREFPGGTDLEPSQFPAGLVPNLRFGGTSQHSAIPTGQWRAIEEVGNVFAYESFIDEIARSLGRDPLAFRLSLIGAPRQLPWYGKRTWDTGRLIGVLKLAADQSRWGRPLPARWGRGIAASFANKAFAAQVAEVEVDAAGNVRVHRVVCAVDCGMIVNRSGAEAQVQGSIIFALGAALQHAITVERGAVEQGNFHDFPLPRITDAPRVEVHFVPSTLAPSGLGEPAVPPCAPAIANAIFDAVGVRVRALPIGRVRV